MRALQAIELADHRPQAPRPQAPRPQECGKLCAAAGTARRQMATR